MRDFRFSVGFYRLNSRSKFTETVRRYEDFGFDVVQVADHLGAPAPFPSLAAAAQVTSTIRLGTYVLNACFYKPALLARDAADVNLLSDGRLELGLGAGYVREEFEAAELPFANARNRIEYLEHVMQYLKEHHPEIPLMIAGNGDRVLTVAAKHVDIIGLTGEDLADRVAFVRAAAGERADDIELNLAVTGSPSDESGVPDLEFTRRYAPNKTDEELLALPSVLSGTPRDIADTLRELRATYGLSYITVQHRHAEYFAKVVAELR